MPAAVAWNNANSTTGRFWNNTNSSNNYKINAANLVSKQQALRHAGPSSKWIPKRLEEDDEDTTDVSASSHGSFAGDEEVPWSCPSEEEESPGQRRRDGRADSADSIEVVPNGGQFLLAMLKSPSTTPKMEPAPPPEAKPGRTKLTTSAAIFVPRGAAPPPEPLPSFTCTPTLPVGGGIPKSGAYGHGAFIPAQISDGHSAVRGAVGEAFPGKPWGLCVSPGVMPQTGCIEVEVALRVSCEEFDDASKTSLGLLQSYLIAQGSQIEWQSTDASMSTITFTFSEVPSDRCCWEWVHYGHCPRPNCRWPHACPIPYCVRLSVHNMADEAMENESQPQFMPLMQDFPASDGAPMMPMYGLPPQVVMVMAPPTGPMTPWPPVVSTTSSEEMQPATLPSIESSNEATEEFDAEDPEKTPRCVRPNDDVVILSTAVDEDIENYGDIEVAFGTVEDDCQDDWTTTPTSGCTGCGTAASDHMEETHLTQAEDQKASTRAKWADMLEDEDDGLPTLLWPSNSSPSLETKEGPSEWLLNEEPAKTASTPPAQKEALTKERADHVASRQKKRLNNLKIQWKAKT